MQTQLPTQSVTWVNFAIEAVKILGPAFIALAGTWIALRYQKKLKEVEIDAQTRLKARELMFAAYQQKSDKYTSELREASRVIAGLSAKVTTGNQEEIDEAIEESLKIIYGAAVPMLYSIEGLEEELKHFGLMSRYQKEFEFIKKVDEEESEYTDLSTKQWAEELDRLSKAIGMLVVITQELLDKKRERLFSEYLPKYYLGQ
jgi:hypothetical protein